MSSRRGRRSATKQYKIVLLGEGSVGKTSIFKRCTDSEFPKHHETTIQAAFEVIPINLPNGDRVEIALWDTAGQERFHSLGHLYYRDSDGAILVYDITDSNSFTRVQTWVKELRLIVGENITLVIVGNKIDLERNRAVPESTALEYAQSIGSTHFYTSAAQNIRVKEMFQELTRMILLKNKDDDSVEDDTGYGDDVIDDLGSSRGSRGGSSDGCEC
eukprot:TRINITY_DN777_c0_g2_i1.p1 TRINITY_DN777_c0_g2~~TRINITY_DN777_c0_g2_i1.p1  ORF type:complete len:216 (+),score=41.37 TRINITY_DN777_c0_g2_i1:45-692(+)